MDMKSIQLIMLGTGNAMATKCYNTCFALKIGCEYFLVDAGGGNGIMLQLEKAEIKYQAIHNMFVTHAHTDHVLGVIWVIRKIAKLMSTEKYDGNLNIYCYKELQHIITTFCEMTLTAKLNKYIGNRIKFNIIDNGDSHTILGMEIHFFDIASTKMKQYGFRAILPNNKILVCLGDEPYNDVCKSYVEHCDWLLSEAFCLYEDCDVFKPYEKHHSTALDAGKLAEALKVANLVLYHTEDTTIDTRKKRYTSEAKIAFLGNVYVPDDLDIIEL